jgi:hypothetical protein
VLFTDLVAFLGVFKVLLILVVALAAWANKLQDFEYLLDVTVQSSWS